MLPVSRCTGVPTTMTAPTSAAALTTVGLLVLTCLLLPAGNVITTYSTSMPCEETINQSRHYCDRQYDHCKPHNTPNPGLHSGEGGPPRGYGWPCHHHMWQCRQRAWQTASGSRLVIVGAHKHAFQIVGFGGCSTTERAPNSDQSENELRIANRLPEAPLKGALCKSRRKGSLQSPHLQSTTAGQSFTAHGLGSRNSATRPKRHNRVPLKGVYRGYYKGSIRVL